MQAKKALGKASAQRNKWR